MTFDSITTIASAALFLFPLVTIGAFLSFLFVHTLSTAANMIAILGMLNIIWLGFLMGESPRMDITEAVLFLAFGIGCLIASIATALIVRVIFVVLVYRLVSRNSPESDEAV